MKGIKLTSMLALLVGMTGCSSMSMNDDFACGVGNGLGCKSVSEVNDIVNSSSISNSSITHVEVSQKEGQATSLAYVDGYTHGNSPSRQPEKKVKIWFAPHVDENDNYVEEMVVYSVVKEAYWKY
jgi:type IV conjugative transfer system lipoprotein TraV